jgi:hypothetical protein
VVVGSPYRAKVRAGAFVEFEPIAATMPVRFVPGDNKTTGMGGVALSSLNDVLSSLLGLDRRSGEFGFLVQVGVLVSLLVK